MTIIELDKSDEIMKAIHDFGLYVFRSCDTKENFRPDII